MFFVVSFWMLGLVAVEGLLLQFTSSFVGLKWGALLLAGVHLLAWMACVLVTKLSPHDMMEMPPDFE